MSRSYKKNVGWVDRNPFMKNYANRRLRRKSAEEEIPNGRAYKKYQCSWDICDFASIYYGGYKEYKYWETGRRWYGGFRNPPSERELQRGYARMRSK